MHECGYLAGWAKKAASQESRCSNGLLVLLLLCLLFQAALVQAQPAPLMQPAIKSTQSLLLDIARAGTRLVAVGERGHVIFSDDEAATWQEGQIDTRQLLTAVYFVDDTHGWLVGHDAQIFHSYDGGLSWTLQYRNLELEAPLLDVWFADRYTGFAVGAYGALLQTTDGGQTWHSQAEVLENDEGFHLNAIASVDEGTLFLAGEMGVLFRSLDLGQSWQKLDSPYEGSFFGLLDTGVENTLLVYGLRGHIFRTQDLGNSWEAITLDDLEFGLAGGQKLADGTLIIVGHGGTVLRSTDAGASFSMYTRSDRQSLAAVSALDDGNLILAGQQGLYFSMHTGASLRAQEQQGSKK